MSCSKILQEKGYRLTPQRMMVLDALHSIDQHISAEEIYGQVRAKYPYANISTIYRTLELLKELGLVTEIDLDDGRIRYHLTEKGHHHHLICSKCGDVIDLPEHILLPLKEILLNDYKFEADLKHLAIFGLCKSCRDVN
jgi:Fur family ferric uptake transcriptional regulator